MNKKNKATAAIIAAVLLCVAVSLLVYTRPRKIERRYPMLDLTQCTQIMGDYRIIGSDDDFREFVFYPGDAQYQELIELFRTAFFRTRLKNLLPRGTKSHLNRDGDFQWAVSFRFENVLSDKAVLSGDLLSADDFYGDLELSFNGEQVCCSVGGQEAWLERVLSVITQ